jgi:hypothetical protein
MERVFQMAEKRAEWQMTAERKQLEADIAHREAVVSAQVAAHRQSAISDLVGQVLGFSVAAACVGGAIYAGVVADKPIVAAILLGVPVAGIIQAVRGMTAKATKTPAPRQNKA